MFEILKDIIGFDIKQVFYNNWVVCDEEDVFKQYVDDIYLIFRKFGHFDIFVFLDEFVRVLNENTNETWKIVNENGNYKIVNNNNYEIKINGDLNRFKMDVYDYSSARYYVKDNKYYPCLFFAYENLYKANISENFDELINSLNELKTKYESDLQNIDVRINDIKQKKLKYVVAQVDPENFTYEGHQFGYSILDETLKFLMKINDIGHLKYDSNIISFFEELVKSLNKDYYKIALKNKNTIVKDGKILKNYGFEIDDKNNAIIFNDSKLYSKANIVLKHLKEILSLPDFSRENLTDAHKSLEMNDKEFAKKINKIRQLINNFNEFRVETKRDMANKLYNQSLSKLDGNLKEKSKLIFKHLYIEEIDGYAFDLVKYVKKVIETITTFIDVRTVEQKKIVKNLGLAFLVNTIKNEQKAYLIPKYANLEKILNYLLDSDNNLRYHIGVLKELISELNNFCDDVIVF